MDPDEYYSIDSILAEQQRIPCIVLHDFRKEINLSGDNTEVKRGTRIDLPYWIAKPLAQFTLSSNESLISVEMPRTYGTRVRNMLDASPTSVDFRLLGPYFYLFGIKLLNLVIDDSLANVLEKAFKVRLRDVMDYSQLAGSSTGQSFVLKLDETEKELFRIGQDSALHFRQWRDRSTKQIKKLDLGKRA